jgi:carbamoylphosphate synthase small subunit
MKNKNRLIVSGFPALGKTYVTETFLERGYNVQDSDSSGFSKHEDFPKNYLDYIRNSDANLIFVSTHESVVNGILNDPELNENYHIVMPSFGMKDEIIDRMIRRGSPEALCEIVMNNYNDWIFELLKLNTNLHVLSSGQYMSDFVYVNCHGKFVVL